MKDILKSKIEILFFYEYISEVDYNPSCIIFYLKNNFLFRIYFRTSISFLKESGHNSLSSFLDVEYIFLENNLENSGEPATDSDVSFINETSDEIKVEKCKLKVILRRQKIQKILK